MRDMLLTSAAAEKPGEHFYKSGARNVLFRLEANFRMYRKIAGSKKLDRWYKDFKDLEDFLGSMDFHESMFEEFKNTPKLESTARKIFLDRYTEECDFLAVKLQENGWFKEDKFNELEKELANLKTRSSEEENKEVALYVIEELEKVQNQYAEGEIDLSKLEEGLHEFRRKIRWISIYAAIMEGGIQLKQVQPVDENIRKYCPDNIVNSSFNKFPEPMPGQESIVVQAPWFYALSWLIQELGELKDTGQRFEAAHELAIQANLSPEEREAFLLDYKTKLSYNPTNILHEAECHIDNFLYRDRIFMRIIRDLKRSLKS